MNLLRLRLVVLILSAVVLAGPVGPRPVAAQTAAPARPIIHWKMSTAFSSNLVIIGSLGLRTARLIEAISDDSFKIRFFEPGALVPPFELFDAVSIGAIDAAWSTPAYWAGKVPSLQLFAAIPFGPDAVEYMAWFYYGGGQELFEELYHRHNIHSVMCGMVSPEASGWFRKEIKTLDDLKGLKMRFFGLGARVMEKLGVSTQLLAPGDIFPALELGTIDATEFSMPAIDKQLGFFEVAKHYYFPGWHQPASFAELIVNLDEWRRLPELQKTRIETVCGDNFRQSIAEGEALQVAALEELEQKGVQFHRWPQPILDKLREAWAEVVAEESATDPDFKRVWASIAAFRAKYKRWRDLSRLP